MKNKINYQPTFNRIIIAPDAEEEITKGGIIIPDAAKEKPTRGTVVAIGTDDDLTVKVGDYVIYSKVAQVDISLDGEKFVMVKEADILAIVNKWK